MKTTIKKSVGIKMVLPALVMFINIHNGLGQEISNRNNSFSVIAATEVAANGYGTLYNPMLCYAKGRSSYAIGPTIQKQKMNFCGMQFNYDYTIAGENTPCAADMFNPRLELFCFVTTAYNKNALLSKYTIKQEREDTYNDKQNLSKLRFQSVEAYGGFGLKIKLTEKIKWTNCIGAGGYASLNFHGNTCYSKNDVGFF